MKSLYFLFLLPLLALTQSAQVDSDETVIRKIYDEALVNGECYGQLHDLCKDIGGRLSGSAEAQKAVLWGKKVMDDYGFDKVYLQEVMVPHWVRGDVEGAELVVEDAAGTEQNLGSLHICALGHSVGTDSKWIQGEIIEVQQLSDLEALGKDQIEGKIVFFNRPMDPRNISTFKSYGGCVDQRSRGASEASEFGAIATIVRSMNLKQDDHPHTGVMSYTDGIEKIPAIAISTNDADKLSSQLKNKDGAKTSVRMRLNCEMLPDVKSYNVIGEITGSEFPDKIIAFGGHLDSWDTGEGAHDDGAGVVQSIEILRIFQAMELKPRHTIRAILFMNEENGNNGGKGYANVVREKGEVHIAAIESDRGGFSPRGFNIDADEEIVQYIAKWRTLLEPYGLHHFEPGYAGVDIGPLKEQGVVLIGLIPDSQRYFDYHHSPDDVFENVNKRELELGAASMASLVYLIDRYAFE